ncbi:uncharacterized protein [Asterias amurensis]|uniref:uncharacterized protein isoform X2 n=1 Tax=Asterias amurensis TaxID=7602 RepID=UPI003AB1A15F
MDKIRMPASFEQFKRSRFPTEDSDYTTDANLNTTDANLNNSNDQKELLERNISTTLTIPIPFSSSSLPATMISSATTQPNSIPVMSSLPSNMIFSSAPTQLKNIPNPSPFASALPASTFFSAPTEPSFTPKLSPLASSLPSIMFLTAPTELNNDLNPNPFPSGLPSTTFSSAPTPPPLAILPYANSFEPTLHPITRKNFAKNSTQLLNLHCGQTSIDIPSSSKTNPDPCPGRSLTIDKLDSDGQHVTDFIMDGHNDECLMQNDAEVKGINHPDENAAEDQFATNSPQECNNTSLPASPRHGFAFQDLDCLENLPDVVENLSHAQKQQAAEIDKQYQILADKKETLKKVQDKLQDISDELSRCKRQICLAEEETTERSKNCKTLQTDIENASLEDLQNSKRIQEVERKMLENERLFADYHSKMKSHKHLVSELESGMTTHLEVKKQLEIIQTLQAENTN